MKKGERREKIGVEGLSFNAKLLATYMNNINKTKHFDDYDLLCGQQRIKNGNTNPVII